MRKSKEEAEKTRRRIVTSSAAEFRERGIVATGLNDLMRAAGLTHGGFYRHFDSKEQLVAEATDEAQAAVIKRMKDAAGRGRTKSRSHGGLAAAVGEYLSIRHRDDPRDGCPLAAMGSELARAGAKTRETATAGFQNLVEILASEFQGIKPDRAKKRALVTTATLVGALTISRIVNDPTLSKAILREAVDSIVSA
jgi:TetR/AcrR family transcriptional regulator, transcriptional repressor for nem operon